MLAVIYNLNYYKYTIKKSIEGNIMTNQTYEQALDETIDRVAQDRELLSSALIEHCLTNGDIEFLSELYCQSRPELRVRFRKVFFERINEFIEEKDLID